MLVVFALMLASGHTFGWLFFSKYLQTYLFFQMESYTASPTIEIALYFSMLIAASICMPIAAKIMFSMPIKAVLCLSCVCILSGSISFIMCSNVWVFIAMQSTFSAIGTSIFQLSSFLLAWEWFPPAKRGLISGVVYSFQAMAMAFIIGLQILIVEYKELAPIQNLEIDGGDVDIYPQKVAMKMILLYFVMCGLQGIVTATVLAFAQRNEI